MTIRFYEVGGCVRDELLGKPSKDVDFTVVAPSFEAMREHLVKEGFRIFNEKPEFATIRAAVPKGHVLATRTKDADFVHARKDGPTKDGRRPQFTEPGTLADDLARRDFTVNALARDPLTGELVDNHGGLEDLKAFRLRFVGDPLTRIREDGLRVLRGFRFSITKGLVPTPETWEALTSPEAARMLSCVSVERRREEVEKMFAHNTPDALTLFGELSPDTWEAIFRGGLRLSATLKA